MLRLFDLIAGIARHHPIHSVAIANRVLQTVLRRTRGMRRSRSYTQKTAIHGQIADTVSISERPASVEDRAVPGHWEGGLVFDSGNSQIATLVERQTLYVMLVKLEGKDSQSVVNGTDKERAQVAAGALQVIDLG